MWYRDGCGELDLTRPIIATSKREGRRGANAFYLLTPQLNPERTGRDGFLVIGYNWLSLLTGQYNSCSFFPSPAAAITSYREDYNIYNVSISLQKDSSVSINLQKET